MEICLPSQNSNIQLIDVLFIYSFRIIDLAYEEILTNTELTKT